METISGVCTEFRYLLVRLGRQLHSHDCEGLIFVHKIPDLPDSKCDVGLHTLSSLEAMGFFDPLSPDKLQEILSKIGRKDLSNDVKEYKQSAVFKKAMKLEIDREKDRRKSQKKGKDGERGDALDERRVAAKLLSGAEHTADQEERRWRDMFAMALTQTAQLVEQTELLRKTIEAHGNSEQTNKSVQEALRSILTAQDEVESLSRTLKKAVSAAGLRSRRASEENILDSDEPDGAANAEGQNKKRPLLPSQSPKLERANTYDGTGKSWVTKPAFLNTSSLCTASSTATPTELTLTPILTPTVPTQAASSVPILTPAPSSAPSSSTPIPAPTSIPFTLATTSSTPKIEPVLSPKPTPSSSSPSTPTRTSSIPTTHKATSSSPSTPTRTSSIPKPGPALSQNPNPSPSSSPTPVPALSLTRTWSIPRSGPTPSPKSTPSSSSSSSQIPAFSSPSTLTRTSSIPTKRPPPPTKPKPSTRTPDFQRKLEALWAEGATKSTVPTSIPHSNTFPSFSTLTSSSTVEPTSTTLCSDFDNEEHVYDNPNLSKEEESGDGLYMNSQMVCNSAEYMNAKGLTKQESEISIQVDSGLGSEDKSWGGELIDMKGKPQYMNLRILEDGYAGLQGPPATPTTRVEYTEIKTPPTH